MQRHDLRSTGAKTLKHQRARTLAISLSVLLAGTAFYASNVRAQTSTLPSTNTIAIPTYESVGLYWQSPGGSAGCEVKYRKWGTTAWAQGLAMWYDSRDAQCRGSLVGLAPGTDYQVEFNLPGQAATRGLVFKTWANQLPVAKTITVPAGSGTFNVAESGTASGYVVYDGKGATLDAANGAQYNVSINASYVIVRGLVLKGAIQDAIRISPTVHDVIIEDNDMSGWGRTRDGKWGADMDSAVRAVCSTETLTRVTIQRNKMHDPRYSANSWSDGHPAGPQGITFSYCGGNHVIRHNEIYSTGGNRFNDGMGGEDNFSKTGFPNADSDIYGNRITGTWDDGIEAEGANENVRIWGNYMDRTATGVATTVTSVGPVYIFRNVWNRNTFYQGITNPDNDDRQPLFKSGSDASLGDGRRYLFHNTMLQATQSGSQYGLGGGAGVGGTGSTQPINNTVSMNNIYHLWKPNGAMYQVGKNNQFANDLYNGNPGEAVYVNGMQGTPVYASGNGWQSEAGGMYQLASTSPGYGRGAKIANFNDGVAAPDVGAHQSGTAAMKFGVAGSAGSAVGGSGTTTTGGGGTTTTSYALTVSRAGTGTGTVTSSPAGISCGSSCTASLAGGTAVTLTATPATGSTFAGWSGACTGTAACTVTMTAAKTVSATFNTAASGLALSKTSLTFGTLAATQYVTVTNKTTATVTLQGVTSSSYKYATRLGCSSLAAGRSCSIAVTYYPTRTGTKSTTITVKSTAPNSPNLVSATAP